MATVAPLQWRDCCINCVERAGSIKPSAVTPSGAASVVESHFTQYDLRKWSTSNEWLSWEYKV